MEEFDQEKFQFYLQAKFYFSENLLFSTIVRQPDTKYIHELKQKMTKNQIEQLYNHFHLNSICNYSITQSEIAVKIWQAWRHFFNTYFPKKNITIEITDSIGEIILYVYDVSDSQPIEFNKDFKN